MADDPSASQACCACLEHHVEVDAIPNPVRCPADLDALGVTRSLQKFLQQPRPIIVCDPECGGKNKSLALAFLVLRVERVIGEFGRIDKRPLAVGQLYSPSSRANVSASATAFSIALLLFTVSWNSASGVESFTQPPPAWT